MESLKAIGLAAAVYLGVAALYLPDPEPPAYHYRPLCEPTAAAKSCTRDTECPKNQVCVSGTCGMAACSPEHGTTVAGVTGDTWSLN